MTETRQPDAGRGGSPDVVVTLVHGTFARGARWTRDDSTFCRLLREQLSASESEIGAFDWSGRNSPRARGVAAQELSKILQGKVTRRPESRHYVVGHSHGGAVALKALEASPDLWRTIDGVATLATPFITLREREIAGAGHGETLTRLWFIPLVTVLGATVGIAVASVFWELSEYGPPWLFWLGFLSAGFVVALSAHRLSRRVAAISSSIAESARSQLECNPPPGFNLFVVRSAGDEASALLAFSQLLAWAVGRLWRVAAVVLTPVFFVIDRLERIAGWLPGLLAFLLACLVPILVVVKEFIDEYSAFLNAMTFSGDVPKDDAPFAVELFKEMFAGLLAPLEDPSLLSIFVAVFSAAFLIALLVALGSLVLWPVLILLGIALLPFGAEGVLTTLFVEVSVEPVPRGAWRTHQYSADPRDEPGLFSLAHSAAYHDPRVIRDLASWMSKEPSSRMEPNGHK